MRRYRWGYFGRRDLLVLVAVCCLTACTAFKPKVNPVSPGSQTPPRKVTLSQTTYMGVPCFLHKVRWPEESLDAIARWYTGSTRNARILARITPNLREADLRPGDVVFIPRELARRDEPMPRNYALRFGRAVPSGKHPSAEPEADESSDDDTPPAPYGPRTFPD